MPHMAGSAGIEVARMGSYMVEEFKKHEKRRKDGLRGALRCPKLLLKISCNGDCEDAREVSSLNFVFEIWRMWFSPCFFAGAIFSD